MPEPAPDIAPVTPQTRDAVLGGAVRLRQPADGYRAAIDPVLLAAAVPIEQGESALEIGCGVGTASLCLAYREPSAKVTGFDRDPAAIELANANREDNGMSERVTFAVADARDGAPAWGGGRFDHVFSNPPYLPAGRADTRTIAPARRGATVESLPLARWIETMADCAAPRAALTLIHRADRLEDVLAAMSRVAGGLVAIPVWPRAGEPARRILVRGRRGSRAPTVLAAGLVLHADDGTFTHAARRVLERGEALIP